MINSEREASALLTRLKINVIPIPVLEIATRLNIRISYAAFEGDVSGVLIRDNESVRIGVNKKHVKERQRFTVAHELGHFVLHPGRPMVIDHQIRVNLRDSASSLAVDTDEIEANQFAAELLMPRDLLAMEVSKITKSRDLEVTLAKRFNVSEQAMSYRLTNLGLRDPR